MNVASLIEQLQKMAEPNDEVYLIIDEQFSGVVIGVFTGKVIGTGSGAETGKCEIYGLA